MVYRSVFWLVAGVGAASLPVYVNMHLQLKKQQQEIHEEFKDQKSIVYQAKIN